jgi:hypothetical protein
MILGDFRDILIEYMKAGSTSFLQPTATGAINEVINRGLKSFTRFTFCNYDVSQSLSLTAGTSTYDVSPMFHVDAVYLNGTMLTDRDGQVGLESRNYMISTYPDMLTDTVTGTPVHAVWLPRKQLLFYPAPSTNQTAYLAGFCEHTTITSTSPASTVLEIEDSYADLAALWISFLLKEPHMEGAELFNQIMAKDAYAGARLSAYASSNRGAMWGPPKRSTPTRRISI